MTISRTKTECSVGGVANYARGGGHQTTYIAPHGNARRALLGAIHDSLAHSVFILALKADFDRTLQTIPNSEFGKREVRLNCSPCKLTHQRRSRIGVAVLKTYNRLGGSKGTILGMTILILWKTKAGQYASVCRDG
jgi:hypothetical protein